jgi:hypothetical protein
VVQKVALTAFLSTLLALGFGLVGGPILGMPPVAETGPWTGPARSHAERVVFLGGNLPDENLIAFTSGVAASGHPGVVLFDSAKSNAYTKDFLANFQPERVLPVGSFPEGVAELERRLDRTVAPALAWKRGPPDALWQVLFPKARRVVVCPAQPRRLLLQAACLAGAVRAPLYILQGEDGEREDLRRRLGIWETHDVYAVGAASRVCRGLGEVHLIRLADEAAVAASYLKHQLKRGSIHTLVVANPADTKPELGGMSALAPWIALQRRAVLLLTNDEGTNVESVVKAALRDHELRRAEALIFVANLKAIPVERRPNPIPGDKDTYIEMEPLTPTGSEPFTFATGRLFHEDPNVVALMLARQRLLRGQQQPGRKVLVVSNPGGGLALLEAFSRNTAKELHNAGYDTTAIFGKAVNKEDLRRLLPQQDIFLWEGHHNTLIREYCVQEWPEPLRPSLVFLQSCLALAEPKAHPFLQRGGLAVVGSSTRTYSGSGGAFTLAFFNALLYEHQTLGGSLRQAKNFLLAYSLLKEKRLGKDAKRGGANVRSAWAFTLWGDPTLKLPRPPIPDDALQPVRPRVRSTPSGGSVIVVSLPDTAYEKVVSTHYQTEMRPNGRLAGLLTRGEEDDRHLVPFVFAEVRLPPGPPGQKPKLRSRLADKHWVFCWDQRRNSGYLLITPRHKDRELRFHVEWSDVSSQ